MLNKGFGDQSAGFRGLYFDEYAGGQANILWDRPDITDGNNATYFGGNIRLHSDYFSDEDANYRRSILYHESIHSRQQSRYGFVGGSVRGLKLRDRPPRGSTGCGRFGFSWEDVIRAGETYGGDFSLSEIEAELYQNDFLDYLRGDRADYVRY